MDHYTDSSFDLFHSFYEWLGWSKRHNEKYFKALLLSGGDADHGDAEISPLEDREKVAILLIRPPGRNLSACCTIDNRKNANSSSNNNNTSKLQDDPVSLCIAGGLRAKIQTFCKETGKAHGDSKTYTIVFWGSFLLSMICFIPLLVRDPWFQRCHLFVWIAIVCGVTAVAEKAHKTSTKFLDSKQQFWRSLKEAGLESQFAVTLARCGYFCEIVETYEQEHHCWELSLYKKGRDIPTSLPPPTMTMAMTGETDEMQRDEESAQKRFQILTIPGVFEHRCSYDNTPESNGDPLPSTNDTNADNPPPAAPLDFWTMCGLFLGRALNHTETSVATHRFIVVTSLLMGVLFVGIPSTFDDVDEILPFFVATFCVLFIGIILWFAAIRTFYEFVDMPKFHVANDRLTRRLSPLVHDRHDGYSILYEIKPMMMRRNGCCWKRGVFVLEKQTPANSRSVGLCSKGRACRRAFSFPPEAP